MKTPEETWASAVALETKKTSYREALATWRSLVKMHNQREQLALDLFTHPDAKPEDMEKIRLTLVEGRKELRAGYKRMVEASHKAGAIWSAPERPRFMERK